MLRKKINTSYQMVEVFSLFQDELDLVYLDSGKDKDKLGRYSFLMRKPFKKIKFEKDQIIWIEKGIKQQLEGDIFEVLQSMLDQHRQEKPADIPFVGGLAGYFSYDLGRSIETLPLDTVDDMEIPALHVNFYHGSLCYDHVEESLYYHDYDADGLGNERYEEILALMEEGEVDTTGYVVGDPRPFTPNMTKEEYLAAIEKIKDYIYEGDIYQANFTQRFERPFTGGAPALYHTLRRKNPAPFAGYLNFEEVQILSSSPERFIELRGGTLRTRPIKGTIERGTTPEEDNRLAQQLLASEKDRSELLMIVDLERNDISKVAKVGSVNVPELFVVEHYATVHHLVATVEGQLADHFGEMEVIKATFPGGSITGAPKIRAMEVIEELEPTQRNIYTGSIGYIDFSGDMDLNIVIRTILLKNDKAYFQVGGGIVWDSDPQAEYEETLAKGKALFEAFT